MDGKYKPTYFATQQERDAKMAELTREIQAEERPLTAEERSWIHTIRSAAKASGVDEQDTSAWLFATLSERSRKDAEQANKGLVPTTPTPPRPGPNGSLKRNSATRAPRALNHPCVFPAFLCRRLVWSELVILAARTSYVGSPSDT